jgi:hypothetical protein
MQEHAQDFSNLSGDFRNPEPSKSAKTNNEMKLQMKTKILSKALLSLGMLLMIWSTITQVCGGDLPSSAHLTSLQDVKLPVVTIHSTGDVRRGKTGSFVLNMNPPVMPGGSYVNFSVSGTAIPGVDYVPLVSPGYVGPSGYGVILVQTLPDPRASSFRQSYSVLMTLESGPGYEVGQPSSARMLIKP